MATSPNAYGASANPIGTSTETTSPWADPHSRPLTSGEVALAQTIFQNGIDYTTVKVHDEGYLWFGMQPAGSGMTPNGEMYITKDKYGKDKNGSVPQGDYCIDVPTGCSVQFDYSAPSVQSRAKSLFIHEMVHIWQYQLGLSVKLHGICTAISGGYSFETKEDEEKGIQKVYKYDPYSVTQTKFSDFNFEQQGAIIADYYLATVYPATNKDAVIKLPGLQLILTDFFKNPNDKKLLPK
jgi:hypothetical protein